MKNLITIGILAISTFAIGQVKESRDLNGFSKIDISSTTEAYVQQGDSFEIIVEAKDQESVNKVETKVVGETIHLDSRGEKTKVYVTLPELNKIKASGTSLVKSTGVLESSNLDLSTSGTTKLMLSIKTGNLSVQSSGASDVALTGFAENLYLSSSGASNFEGKDMEVNYAQVSLSGASNSELKVNESITGTLSGASNLDISGEPKVQAIKRSGVSSLDSDSKKDYTDEVTVSINSKEGFKLKENGDTTRITLGKKKLLIIDDWDQTKVDLQTNDSIDEPWEYGINGLFLGVNGFLNSNNNQLKVPSTHEYLEMDIARSKNVQFNLLDANIKLYKNYVTFHPGLGLEFNSYEFRKNYWINPSSGNNDEISATEALLDTVNTLKFGKNRLKSTYLNAPIMLAFHTNDNHEKAFHIGVGGYVGTRLTSKMKYKYSLNGKNRKDKVQDDYYLNPFRYGLMASVGYSNVNFFASYALNGLFEDGKGPELQPFTIGMRVIGF